MTLAYKSAQYRVRNSRRDPVRYINIYIRLWFFQWSCVDLRVGL